MESEFNREVIKTLTVLGNNVAGMTVGLEHVQKASEKHNETSNLAIKAAEAASNAAEAASKAAEAASKSSADVIIANAQVAREMATATVGASQVTQATLEALSRERVTREKITEANTKEIAAWKTTTKVVGTIFTLIVTVIGLWLSLKGEI